MIRKRTLITGATGNIGCAVLDALATQSGLEVHAGVRNIERARPKLAHFSDLQFRTFDFESPNTFDALDEIDVLFLLRPPHLATIAPFKVLLESAKAKGIKKIVFLSVQGVEKSSVIPHHKIEKLIESLGFEYVFLRPGYFMQNLSTTLYQDIKEKRQIILPAGNAKFNWVDVKNIGEVAAQTILRFDDFKNRAIEITGEELKNFNEVVEIANTVLKQPIRYKSLNPISFFFYQKKKGTATPFIIVMIMLHFLPRFQTSPQITHEVENITGNKPTRLIDFFKRDKALFD